MYVDTSAVFKLLVAEPESAELLHVMPRNGLVSSELMLVELRRGALRLGLDVEAAAGVVADIALLDISSRQLQRAGRLPTMAQRALGTLDAIHLACALELEEDSVLTYDAQLAAASVHHGLSVLTPGRADGWWA